MKCEKCGHENEAKVLYCTQCGAKIIYTKRKVKEEYERKITEEKIRKGIELTQLMLLWSIVIFFILLAVRAPFTKYH
ncbi:MAG: zinc-ribbon domain-containing protein [Planctomycetota bacterium]